MKYNPKIHTQVHPANTKPVHVGWYAACQDSDADELNMLNRFTGRVDSRDWFWWYWDGKYWLVADEPYFKSASQERRWFGLLEKAK